MAEMIVALDVSTLAAVEQWVAELSGVVSFYKIGLELFSSEGPRVVEAVKKRGCRVFLDLKLHDIPRTVGRAVAAGAALGVDLLTLHAAGGRAMIRAAQEAAAEFGTKAPQLLAVTVLTSLDEGDLQDIGVTRAMPEQVAALGSMACESGANGIVCSPREVAAMRHILGGNALLVTPGIRPAGSAVGDQKRLATPAAAVRDGATHLVVGRPVLEASDPVAAASAILQEMRSA